MGQIQKKIDNVGLAVHELLMERSATCAGRFSLMFLRGQPKWVDNLPIESQITLLNVFWRVQLGSLSHDTHKERSMLFDNVDAHTWLANFKKYVVNTVVNNQLPNVNYVI